MASKLEVLQQNGCIAEGAKLSDAEKAVIEGLSKEEVETLVAIRKRLNQEIAKQGTSAIASGDLTPSSNIVI